MTPTDALIEKMARAHYELVPARRAWNYLSWEKLGDGERSLHIAQMRAAYEAEHEESK